MALNLREQAEREGGTNAERIPAGDHAVRICKIVYGKGQTNFQSRDGTPQIMIIFQDELARESSMMVTLHDRAIFRLAQLLARCDPPADLSRMEADGVEPMHFADSNFADGMLINRRLTIRVVYAAGNKYPEVTPIKVGTSSPVPTATADEPPPLVEDDPPPAAPVETPTMTKEKAWATLLTNWGPAIAGNPDAIPIRNERWLMSIKRIGKPEAQFTSDDWANVSGACEVPF